MYPVPGFGFRVGLGGGVVFYWLPPSYTYISHFRFLLRTKLRIMTALQKNRGDFFSPPYVLRIVIFFLRGIFLQPFIGLCFDQTSSNNCTPLCRPRNPLFGLLKKSGGYFLLRYTCNVFRYISNGIVVLGRRMFGVDLRL